MKKVRLGNTSLQVPAVVAGCMRLSQLGRDGMNAFIHTVMESGVNFFDHADIYAYGGVSSEALFGEAMQGDSSLRREDMILQSKCGIRKGYYDLSRDYILESVDGILKRLRTEYLDILLLHRPDALVEPEEVAEAFDRLRQSGKVRYFGVSNHKPAQIELLRKYVGDSLTVNQMQLSLPVSNMIANGIEVNMDSPGAADRDGSVLDYCRLHEITLQAWSPFQMPGWKGCFLGNNEYEPLNKAIETLAAEYGVSDTAIAAAWILRHPAGIQLVSGTSGQERFKEIAAAGDICLKREEWYRLYLAAGHILP
ncbi:MAG: aldo/keto reductase family oxidoreductase [Lachnospiraceae bacterium]|jgi:predicted oxidoreductase|nr:aldo/keto reductase family oxidoreductase [Lachnospiraceae bacterium]